MSQSYFHGVAPIRYEGPQSHNPLAFRWYDKDRMVLGKHSGASAVRRAYLELGVAVDGPLLDTLLARVRSFAMCHKRAPLAGELQAFHEEAGAVLF